LRVHARNAVRTCPALALRIMQAIRP
jgi:hypothetical protein